MAMLMKMRCQRSAPATVAACLRCYAAVYCCRHDIFADYAVIFITLADGTLVAADDAYCCAMMIIAVIRHAISALLI